MKRRLRDHGQPDIGPDTPKKTGIRPAPESPVDFAYNYARWNVDPPDEEEAQDEARADHDAEETGSEDDGIS